MFWLINTIVKLTIFCCLFTIGWLIVQPTNSLDNKDGYEYSCKLVVKE